MASKSRKKTSNPDDLLARVEQLAESLLDVAAEERRMLKTLARLRVVRVGLLEALAATAKAATAQK